MISHIHHLNFLVKDLDLAITRYQTVVGDNTFQIDTLEQRAVRTARCKLGDTWLILVQPLDSDSIPAKHLQEHGEGFFLMSLATDDLVGEQAKIETETSTSFIPPRRTGLDGWQVLDFQYEQFFGVQLQLTEEV